MKYSKKLFTFILTVSALCTVACSKDKAMKGSEYLQGKDDQPFFDGYHNIAGTEEGYYLLGDELISYYDKSSSKIHVLCSKAECMHNNESCNASISTSSIRFYNDKLYCIEPDKNNAGDYNLCEISKDGSSKNALFVVYHEEGTEKEQLYMNDFIVHRGYIYYCLSNFNTEPSVYQIVRRKLEKNAKEEIVQKFYFEDMLELMEFQGVGDYVYYGIVKKDNTEKYNELYAYDTQKHSTECVLDREMDFKDFMAEGNKVYYTDKDNLYVKNKMDNTVEKVMELPEKGCFEISVDEDNFYFDNYCDLSLKFLNSGKPMQEYENPETFQDRKVYIYNKENKKQRTVLEIANSDSFYSGDENIVLLGDEMTEHCGMISILPKQNLGTDSQEWKKIQ